MSAENSNETWVIVIGAIGVALLLLGSLGYALRDSGTFFEPERINQFVIEQQTASQEDAQ